MRLLVFTQKVDKTESILGFFHGWLIELSKKVESIEVICLWKGDFDLPSNVTVYSLGKERGVSRLVYLKNLYHYLFLIAGSYDKVFIHMNQEYVLLAGLYWKLKNIPVYMWRNHGKGSLATRIAVALSTKVFCTSTDSFTARFKKTVIMPAGINTDMFKPNQNVIRKKYSVCMVGRIAPVKHIEIGISAVSYLILSGTQVSLTIIGSPLAKDFAYYERLKTQVNELNLSPSVRFLEEVSPDKISEIYGNHEICLNLTESGSFDKTIVEAAACGTLPLVSNISLTPLLPEECLTEATPEAIGNSIQKLLNPHQRVETQTKLELFVKFQSLTTLISKLVVEIA